jgi:hypothetical protein
VWTFLAEYLLIPLDEIGSFLRRQPRIFWRRSLRCTKRPMIFSP